jgi:hypothetical protein
MARAQGSRAQMVLAYESIYGIWRISRFLLMPFARATFGLEHAGYFFRNMGLLPEYLD